MVDDTPLGSSEYAIIPTTDMFPNSSFTELASTVESNLPSTIPASEPTTIVPTTAPPIRRSTRTIKPPIWSIDYVSMASSESIKPHFISQFVSYDKLSSAHKVYISYISKHRKPKTYFEAIQSSHWRQAMVDELQALSLNQTWELVPRPPHKQPIGCKWMDVHNALIHGDLDKEIYMEVPPGIRRQGETLTAEGFVEAKEGKTMEEVAQEYLSELLNRSLMQVAGTTSDGRVKACRIHDFLREIIKTKSREHNIAAIAKEHMNQNTLWPDKVQRLSVHNTLQNVQQNRFVNASQLRSLFMFGIDEKPRLHALFPSGFKLLGVLDMRGTPVTKFPIEVMNLYYLKYMSLRDTKLKTIPRYIGKLQNLETLDLKHAYVTELPSDILNLKKLRHLMVYRYEYETFATFKYGFKSLEKIGVLQSLQKLSFIEANHVGTLQELGKLTQLKRLGIIKLRKQDGKMLCSSIEHLTNLRTLSITSTEESEIIDLQHLHHPPQLLQRIYLTGRLESLPHWITYVHSLVKLKLRWARLKEDPLVFLQDLPNLVHLELVQVYDGDMLCFMAGGFKKLKLLGLYKFEGLRFVEIQKGAMSCIENLRIQRCKSLQKVPLGIEHLSQLKMLEFFDLPHKLLKTIRRDEGGEDYWRVAHIPKVNSTTEETGMGSLGKISFR
ncbi:disease resistance protein RPM1-like [Mangifera indica]|uniref:disease resistance protein RPM1-like n=1 Tax=Mangifera indica TaxID=29780 RepID=UPI001CFA2FD7|nr:disease resistance protein RPM1-like [Mangifera indica]